MQHEALVSLAKSCTIVTVMNVATLAIWGPGVCCGRMGPVLWVVGCLAESLASAPQIVTPFWLQPLRLSLDTGTNPLGRGGKSALVRTTVYSA